MNPQHIDGRDLWLGVKVGADPEMTPRIPISSVFYARSLAPGAIVRDLELLDVRDVNADGDVRVGGDLQVGGNIELDNLQVTNDIEAGRNIRAGADIIADDEVVANTHVTAGQNVVAGRDVIAGDDVSAADEVHADGDVSAGGDVRSGGQVLAASDIASLGRDVAAARDVVAGDDVIASDEVGARRVNATQLVISGGNVQAGQDVIAGDDVIANGDVLAGGVKPAYVQTRSFGQRLTYAIEGAAVWFVDQGQAQLHKGVATITLDPIFLQTVTINEQHPMLVQITLTGDAKGVYVAEQTATGFTVRELQGGTSDATFNWQVSALRRGYEDTRLEPFEGVEGLGGLSQ